MAERKAPPPPLQPGSTIGMLGGGQLGRMAALAAARLGYRTHVFCPEKDAPATQVTPLLTQAAYDDEEALAAFAEAVDVITYEFENVPAKTAAFLQNLKPLRPGANALAVSQDRLAEKAFLSINRIPVAPFAAITDLDRLEAELAEIGTPAPYTGPNVPTPPEMVAEGPGKAEVPAWMNSAKQLGAAQAATMKTVGTLVEENPKQAALIVRDWLSSAT